MPSIRTSLLALAAAGALSTAGSVTVAAADPAHTTTAKVKAGSLTSVVTKFLQAAVAPRIWETETSKVTQTGVTLDKGETVTIETTGLSAGADPVLHLLDTSGHQVAMDDDSGVGKGARLTYTSPKHATHYLVVRAGSNATGGTATLVTTLAHRRSQRPISFTGWSPIFMAGLRGGEKITSVRLPGGAASGHRLFLLARDGRNIETSRIGRNGAQIIPATAVGSRSVVLTTTGGGTTTERARLVRNDAALWGADNDRDGVGRELEAALHTCATRASTVAGVSCASVADLRDTDGDGLSDGLETVGVISSPNGVSRYLPLPLWGANPRHKDLFVEVDFMRRTKQENDDRTEQKMPASVARKFADYYGDTSITSPYARALHALSVRNPDGKPGIAVHLDTGVEPQTAADAAIYGDWGGYSAVDAIQVDGEYKGVTAGSAWKTAMDSIRRGVFRYALAYGTGGGSTGRGFTASYNFNSSFVAPHETGHSLGLGHGGPYGAVPEVNCKPNYPSPMNYAYYTGVTAFADGRGAEGAPLNNASLTEFGVAKGASSDYFTRLETVFGYYVDRTNGHVDWNRDGAIARRGTTVRAYANLAPSGGGCEFTRWNKAHIQNTYTYLPPALARFNGKLHMIYGWGGNLYDAQSSSSWNCPAPTPGGCAGGTWGHGLSLSLPTSAASADAVTIRSGGKEELVVVANGLDGSLWARSLIAEHGSEHRTSWRRLTGTAGRGGPSVALASDGSVYVAYANSAGAYKLQRRSPTGVWSAEQAVRTTDGVALGRPAGSHFSPGIVEAKLVGKTRIYALFAAADDRLDLWGYDKETRRWEKTDLFDTRPGPVTNRPAMAWVPPGPTSSVGRLHVVYSRASDSAAKMMMSYVMVTRGSDGLVKRQRVGLDTYFDNVWRLASGIDLLYEQGHDTNLRAVLAYPNAQLWFHPKADGINDHTYTNHNDWPVLAHNVCAGVVNPGDLVPNPIHCSDS